MNTKKVYHYVYRITNVVENKHYYGKRSSKNVKPEEDLGKNYFSSSTDLLFIQDQKSNPQKYRYKVVSLHPTASRALEKEIKLHHKFKVGVNTNFYNRVIQTSTKFDSTGMASPMKGKTHTKESKDRMSKAKKGIYTGSKSTNAKLANLYNYRTGEVVAEKVVIVEWCKENPDYTPSTLYSTASCDRSLPSCGNNPHQHKNICVLYISDKDFSYKENIYLKGVKKRIEKEKKSYPQEFTKGQKISWALKGKPKSKSHIENSAKSRTKIVNIRKFGTGELVASGVKVKDWCIENGYTYSKVYATLKADRNKPHSRLGNPLHHKQIYAEYSDIKH